MEDFIKRHPWIATIARDVLVALLISVLTVLGYDINIAKPRMQSAPAPIYTAPRATTHLSALEIAGNLGIGAKLYAAPGANDVVTDGETIAPIAFVQPISSTAAVGAAIATTGRNTGDLLLLYNTGSNTITITDTGNIVLAGNAALGQYDTLLLIFDGTRWVQISKADN